MGRHSSPEQASFYRSLFGWFLPWVLVAAVAGVAVWIAVGAIGRGPLEASPPQSDGAPQTSTRQSGSPDGDESPSPSPTTDENGGGKDGDSGNGGGGGPELITEGVSVQVLNATTSSQAGARMAGRLADLGFEIVAVGQASRVYEDTTVFWSSKASRPAARALGKRFGWKIDPAPGSLSQSVDVHVVVGSDEV